MTERTLVLVKPDGVKRGLIGKIISRFEDIGLKIVGMKLIWADEKFAEKHYELDDEWAKNVFNKTKTAAEKEGKKFEYDDHLKFGKQIQKWNMNFLREGPVIAMVLEGAHSVEIVRKIVGHTEPRQAIPGTIRADFASLESYNVANSKERVVRNLIHASDSVENAEREISLWFNKNELFDYKTVHQDHSL